MLPSTTSSGPGLRTPRAAPTEFTNAVDERLHGMYDECVNEYARTRQRHRREAKHGGDELPAGVAPLPHHG